MHRKVKYNYLYKKGENKMTTEELKNLQATKIVDARGTACPGPLLAAKKAIGDIESGEVLEVLSSDEGTKHDIPKWCEKMEHEFMGIVEEDSYSRLFLKKA
jgi:tRNA 2-thiouridine synthesizing protein A